MRHHWPYPMCVPLSSDKCGHSHFCEDIILFRTMLSLFILTHICNIYIYMVYPVTFINMSVLYSAMSEMRQRKSSLFFLEKLEQTIESFSASPSDNDSPEPHLS